jgi:hypothetical protein
MPNASVACDGVPHWGGLRQSSEPRRAAEAANRGTKAVVAGGELGAAARRANAARR